MTFSPLSARASLSRRVARSARAGESGEKDKYEKLHQRDEEMTQFIAEFEATRAAEVAEQQSTQETVVALLEHISSGLAAEQVSVSSDCYYYYYYY